MRPRSRPATTSAWPICSTAGASPSTPSARPTFRTATSTIRPISGASLGPSPIIDARWKPVTYSHSDSAWYYCSNWNVRYEPGHAKELLKTGPQEYDRLPHGRPYDGHPWWQAKKRGGSKTLPVASAVSTSLPASPVNPASVVNIDNKDDENIVLDIDNYPIVADPIAP